MPLDCLCINWTTSQCSFLDVKVVLSNFSSLVHDCLLGQFGSSRNLTSLAGACVAYFSSGIEGFLASLSAHVSLHLDFVCLASCFLFVCPACPYNFRLWDWISLFSLILQVALALHS